MNTYGRHIGELQEPESLDNGILMEKVATFYHKALLNNSTGTHHLKDLCLDDSSLLETFQIGYCDGSLLKILPESFDNSRNDLLNLGILKQSGQQLIEAFHNNIVLPIYNSSGCVAGLYGIDIKHASEQVISSTACTWNVKAARIYTDLIVTRKVVDALSLVHAGYLNVIALLGESEANTVLQQLKDLGVRKLFLLGAKGSLPHLQSGFNALPCSYIDTPAGFTPNSHLVKYGKKELADFVEKLIADASPNRGLDSTAQHIGDSITITVSHRRYILKGIEKGPRKLKATIRTDFMGKLYIDTVDFYCARSRRSLCQDLALFFNESAELIEADITRFMRLAEEYQPPENPAEPAASPELSQQERQEAEEFGRDENLIEHITDDFEACGLIGENISKLVAYIAMVTRKMDDPVSVLILSSSGAGKTALQDICLNFCPPEDVIKLTSLTGKALFYKEKLSLKHKVLALEEGAGAENASYAIRSLITSRELVIESTMKDNATGKMTTMVNRVEGPTTVFLTTTNPETDAESRSRFIVISIDESREQTRRILEFQRKQQTLDGLTSRNRVKEIVQRHRNYQKLLRPLEVVNPFADKLVYTDDTLQGRRDQPKYLAMIKAVAFLRQMQKPMKRTDTGMEYIEVDHHDIEIANKLMMEILDTATSEVSRPSINLLILLDEMVKQAGKSGNSPDDITFSRRTIREFTGWTNTRLHVHLKELVSFEYLLVVAGRNGIPFQYRLAWNSLNNANNQLIGKTVSKKLGTVCSPFFLSESFPRLSPACQVAKSAVNV